MNDLVLKKNTLCKVTDEAFGARIVGDFLEIPPILFDNMDYFEIRTAKDLYIFIKWHPLATAHLLDGNHQAVEKGIEELKKMLSSVVEEDFFAVADTKYPCVDSIGPYRKSNAVKPDLKSVLMILGNTLVTEHGFDPAYSDGDRSTNLIKRFTDWVNSHPEAQSVLLELGFNWSMPKKGS